MAGDTIKSLIGLLALVGVLAAGGVQGATGIVALAEGPTLALPEEKSLQKVAPMCDSWLAFSFKERPGNIGWLHLQLQRAELDGKKVFLARRDGGMLNLEAGRVDEVWEVSLWDAKGGMIRLQTLGGKSAPTGPMEAVWQNGEVQVRPLAGTPAQAKSLKSAQAPSAEEDVLMAIAPAIGAKKQECSVLDTEDWTLKKNAISWVGPAEIAVMSANGDSFVPKSANVYHSTRLGGIKWTMETNGVVLGMEPDGAPFSATQPQETGQALISAVRGHPLLLRARGTKMRAAWRQNGMVFTNAELGLSLRLPDKGWQRTEVAANGPVIFSARRTDEQSSFSVHVEIAPQHTLETYAKKYATVLQADEQGHPNSNIAVTSQTGQLGAMKAFRLEVREKNPPNSDPTLIYIVQQQGVFCRFVGGAVQTGSRVPQDEWYGILRSVKFEQARDVRAAVNP